MKGHRFFPLSATFSVAFLAIAGSTAMAQITTTSGDLSTGPISLDNGVVRFEFFQAQPAGGVELDIVDVLATHTTRHRGAGLWTFDLFDSSSQSYGALESLLPTDCSPRVRWTHSVLPGSRTLTLDWVNCSTTAIGSDQVDVSLHLSLDDGQETAQWLLSAESRMRQFSFWSGSIHLSLEEDAAEDQYFLDPYGFLTRNPGANLRTWSLGTPQAQTGDMQSFKKPLLNTVPQVAAYYDESGNGVYFAGADGSGLTAKSYRFKRIASVAGEPNRLDYQCLHYTGDVWDPSSPYAGLPMNVGVFQGDWFDAAFRYRDWLDTVSIGSLGPVATRPDVADFAKNLQQVVVLTPQEDYAADPLGTGQQVFSVPQRIRTYMDHHWLTDVTTVAFGGLWAIDDECGTGEYSFDSTPLSPWPNNLALMQAEGLPLLLYILDLQYMFDPSLDPSGSGAPCPDACVNSNSYWNNGWDRVTTVNIMGQPYTPGTCTVGDPQGRPSAFIDGGSQKWLNHINAVAASLATWGASGVYIDNLLPGYYEACYSTSHGHSAGLSKDYLTGHAKTLESLKTGGRSVTPDFEVSTESGQYEGYIPFSGTIGGDTAFGDYYSGIPEMQVVPLQSTLYHKIAIMGITAPGVPFLQILPQVGDFLLPLEDNVWLGAALSSEVQDGRRGAMYATAYAVVNGNPLWVPDQASFTPRSLPWSFESGPINLDYDDCINYAAAGCRFRGATSARPYLNYGERMRDLPLVAPAPTLVVPVATLPYDKLNPANNVLQTNTVPALLQGIWRNTQNDDIGIALANHSSTQLVGLQVVFDPVEYGLDPTIAYTISEVVPGLPDMALISATGVMTLPVPVMAPESFRFFEVTQP